MRFDSGQAVFVRVNQNYVLTAYVLNENDCTSELEQMEKKYFDRRREKLLMNKRRDTSEAKVNVSERYHCSIY